MIDNPAHPKEAEKPRNKMENPNQKVCPLDRKAARNIHQILSTSEINTSIEDERNTKQTPSNKNQQDTLKPSKKTTVTPHTKKCSPILNHRPKHHSNTTNTNTKSQPQLIVMYLQEHHLYHQDSTLRNHLKKQHNKERNWNQPPHHRVTKKYATISQHKRKWAA